MYVCMHAYVCMYINQPPVRQHDNFMLAGVILEGRVFAFCTHICTYILQLFVFLPS